MSAFTPHQEARIRVIIAEMIGVALRGADERIKRSQVDAALARDGIVVMSAAVHDAVSPTAEVATS